MFYKKREGVEERVVLAFGRASYISIASERIESLRQHVIALTDCALRFRVAHSELSSPAIS